MIVTTANQIEGHHVITHLGLVRGIVVRSNNIISGFLGSLKTIIGGNISQFERVCDEARRQAYERMVQQARAMGADGIIAMRYDATEFMQGVTEVLAYGTAVKLAAAGRPPVTMA